jgi:hypothetical protein
MTTTSNGTDSKRTGHPDRFPYTQDEDLEDETTYGSGKEREKQRAVRENHHVKRAKALRKLNK